MELPYKIKELVLVKMISTGRLGSILVRQFVSILVPDLYR
jgi:hypothetical protein